ncbi:hypothetical protein CLAFUW4_00921 [Fulvia fulva]|uniref:SnoaL-like domain-containing protein n=1 Tax=Passalora fulva TaxID=5499 RepID=A0A9Q8L8E1_PASFU|nr:uncharacterized protein CLAFUR5_00926 [Fulvia fulva]KAK4634809.1 hypothetical protein CLAFUR4_00922 [Fulvia fulva]KAK4638576.1 hypothetical protein CLAFUR0_00922 [Fulvia fulva]UJO12757.1 hypothetical protein CLAFUR5_00926 [Fulvia fulva]WPV09831.1 hypothetical protein CLAFUW4_00921 [Fulvia fulva]WPV24456.1 hypothetical protein CLAFUW7_00895 [Fulvia fulva]
MPYPSKAEIQERAASLSTEDNTPFFSRVSPDVVWDVMGTHPAAEDWKKGALGVVNKILSEPLKLKVINVIGGGDEWATVELEANATCKNGMAYPQRYAWMLRFDESGTVVQARAYLDSALVQKAVDQNP